MRVGGEAQWTLRLPSVALYLAGLVALAFSAKKISGVAAFLPVISIGVLWPFGFHFGRLVGWYSWSFFLVAILTLAYLRVLEKPSWPRLYAFVVCALLLVYSNYFGWAVIGCIALDIALFRRHPFAARLLLVTIATLGLAYLPLWPILFEIVMTSSTVGMRDISWVSTTLHGLFSLYALFLSESIAPWHWVVSIPAAIAIFVSVVCLTALLDQIQRLFLVYFFLLFGAMTALGIISTKNLFFVSGWLVLSFGLALANTSKPVIRNVLLIALGLVAATGWSGVISRQHYATQHFVEPWVEIANETANAVQSGAVVVSNSRSFAFNLNYALASLGLSGSATVPGYADTPAVFTFFNGRHWQASDFLGRSSVVWVRGIALGSEEESADVENWLQANCKLRNLRKLAPDSGYELKTRYFPHAAQQPYRIQLHQYDCS